MKRVVMVRSWYPDPRLEKEADTLVRHGYAVTLVVWDRGTLRSSAPADSYRVKKMNINVQPASIKVAFSLPLWWLFVMYQLIVEKFDFVHAADFDTYAPALIPAKIQRKPILYDIYDFYADTIQFPLFPKLTRMIILKIDRFLMRFADIVILPDSSRIAQIGVNSSRKVITVVNSPDESKISDIAVDENYKAEYFNIFFGGSIMEDRGIDTMCKAVKGLTGTKLTIMGPCSSSYETYLQDLCADNEHVELRLKWIPHQTILERTIHADLLFALYDPSFPNNIYASPNKLFEAMMCGKPIIVSEGTSMATIVREENCGLVVDYGNVDALGEAIMQLRDINFAQQLINNAKRAYKDKYNWNIMENRLLDTYLDLRK